MQIVRIKIGDDNYKCIATNLDRDEFSLEKIKKYISDSIGTGAADHRILQHCRYQRKRIQSDPTVR